jgi:LuxR family maltose regulon positive regulatory protein
VRPLEPDRPPRAESHFVQRRGAAYGLVLERWDVDADRFVAHIDHAARVETSEPATAIEAYRAAVALYQGDYLPDALYDDWSSAERERLLALYLSSASRLAELVLAEGQDQEAINLAQAVIARDPCWEEVYRVLMRAHVRRGNRPQALRAYERLVRHLDEELGLAPMPETRRLCDQVRAGAAI